MAFTISGSTITQTGTDDTASFISAISLITGVTVLDNSTYTRFIIPYQLSVTGDLSLDHTVGLTLNRATNGTPINYANELFVNSGGTFTYESQFSQNGETAYRKLPDLNVTGVISNSWNGTTRNWLYLRDTGSSVTLRNITVNADTGLYFGDTGASLIFEKVILNAQNTILGNDNQVTTQVGQPNINWDDVTVIGVSIFLRSPNYVQFKGVKPQFCPRGFGQGFNNTTTLEDFEPFACDGDASTFAGGLTYFINNSKGGALNTEPWTAASDGNSSQVIQARLKIKAVDENNNNVNEFKTYYADNITGANSIDVYGYAQGVQKIYNETAIGNEIDLLVLLAESEANADPIRRSVTQTDDLFQLPLISYNNNITQTSNVDLTGTGNKETTAIMLSDISITETDKSIVNAYTTLDTPQEFYDRAKAYLVDNYVGETSTIITRSGNTIDLGSYNLSVDGTAVSVFTFDGTTITINSNLFTGNFKTTGTVTFINGAELNGTLSDANGDSNISATVPTGYDNDIDVYLSQADAESETGQIATGSSFRYNSSSLGGTTVWFRMTQVDGSFIIENYTVPVAAGSYEVSLVVTAENTALGEIKLVTDKLDLVLESIDIADRLKRIDANTQTI